ncbi:MAG: hypothetical protein JRN09_08745 [Nitrososphaerota archaeon]|nr:hypothetical protein [Nitrososphaerota archaeon]
MSQGRFINVRKLAALDLHFRGTRRIIVEFGLGAFGSGALGLVALLFGDMKSPFVIWLGVYLLLLGVDYVPLLAYGVSIARSGTAQEEIREELADFAHSRWKYGLQQTLLMVPLFIPALALWQETHGGPRALRRA